MVEYKVKQVIVLRKDLNMRKGKMVAQGAHASIAVILDKMNSWHVTQLAGSYGEYTLHLPEPMRIWIEGPFAKICVSVDSEEDLLAIYEQAQSASIPTALITDSGNTEFHGVPTHTAVAVGPWWNEEIDRITGDLKLL